MNKSVIIGTLLGDAWIQKYKNKPNSYSFSFSQSIKDYATWKADIIGLKYSIYELHRFDKRTKKTYDAWQIRVSMPKIDKAFFYNTFYKPKKIISNEILELVDDLAIAIWYLDDGNMYYNGNNCHITIAVNGFIKEEKDLIIEWFKRKYNLNFKHSSKAIRITSRRECELFMNIVEKFIPECMKYKKLSEALIKYNSTLTEKQKSCRNSKYK